MMTATISQFLMSPAENSRGAEAEDAAAEGTASWGDGRCCRRRRRWYLGGGAGPGRCARGRRQMAPAAAPTAASAEGGAGVTALNRRARCPPPPPSPRWLSKGDAPGRHRLPLCRWVSVGAGGSRRFPRGSGAGPGRGLQPSRGGGSRRLPPLPGGGAGRRAGGNGRAAGAGVAVSPERRA